jgi:hypothetical protein
MERWCIHFDDGDIWGMWSSAEEAIEWSSTIRKGHPFIIKRIRMVNHL